MLSMIQLHYEEGLFQVDAIVDRAAITWVGMKNMRSVYFNVLYIKSTIYVILLIKQERMIKDLLKNLPNHSNLLI